MTNNNSNTINKIIVSYNIKGSLIIYGNYNINEAIINNCGGINGLDACNITTNTTQIVNGSSEVKINSFFGHF